MFIIIYHQYRVALHLFVRVFLHVLVYLGYIWATKHQSGVTEGVLQGRLLLYCRVWISDMDDLNMYIYKSIFSTL